MSSTSQRSLFTFFLYWPLFPSSFISCEARLRPFESSASKGRLVGRPFIVPRLGERLVYFLSTKQMCGIVYASRSPKGGDARTQKTSRRARVSQRVEPWLSLPQWLNLVTLVGQKQICGKIIPRHPGLAVDRATDGAVLPMRLDDVCGASLAHPQPPRSQFAPLNAGRGRVSAAFGKSAKGDFQFPHF